MSRILLALLACFALAGFTGPGARFSVEFPRGWGDPVPTDATGTVQSNAPDVDGKIWCRANSVALDSLKGQTQAQLNAEFSTPFDHETWAGFYQVDAAQFSESEANVQVLDGRVRHQATLSFKPAVLGSDYKARVTAFLTPGHVLNAACFAPAGDYDRHAATFEGVMASLKPL